MDREREIIKLWGTPEAYFKELETFLKAHEKADCRTCDSEKCLVSVTYVFKPYSVWQDHNRMMAKLREAMDEADTEG